ncbi:MAG: Ig-like domain-containing protein, partial [Patescibacteria group bacterium]
MAKIQNFKFYFPRPTCPLRVAKQGGRGRVSLGLIFSIIFFSVVLVSLFSPLYALAQDWNQGLNQFQTQTGLGNQDLATTIGRIVNIVLGFLGLIAVIIIIIGGFIWMTSGGAQEKIDKAKALIKAGVIGMIIIVLSFTLATFIVSLLKKVGGVEGDLNGQACTTPGACSGCYKCGSDNVWRFDNTCNTCGSNPDSFIVNTIQPEPEGVTTVRNPVVRIYFNHSININTVSAETVKVEQSIGGLFSPVNGDLSLDGDSIVKFTPATNCPVPNEDRKCFDANGIFKVTVSAGLQSTYNNLFLNCSNNKCVRNFKTNDIVDTQAPQVSIVNISPSQGIYVPQSAAVLVTAQATDDSGISKINFYLDDEANPRATVTQPDLGTLDRYRFTLNTTNLALNSSHIIKAKAFDLDENQAMAEKNIIVRADHCFNNTKDGDETGVDCGGNDCQTCPPVLPICGNDLLETNEQCDTTKLNNKTCSLVDSKYISGVLACTSNCAFDVSGCVEAGAVGGAGDVCKISGNTTCSTGASTCQNPPELTTYSCLPANNDCRCCCNPSNPTSCPNSLTCTADKSPCSGLNRGLCCGCKDDSQCGGTNVCDTADSCCHNLSAPFNLAFTTLPTQIQINWDYARDSFKYVTTFQIERAEKTSGICSSYLKIAEDKNCQPPDLQATPPKPDYSCSYIDRGNFAGKQWCYRVRAKHGTNTVYSDYSERATETISSTAGCVNNIGCTGAAPCCASGQCVTWDLCHGQCSFDDVCKLPALLYAEADFKVTADAAIGACLISVVNIQTGSQNFDQNRGYWLDNIKAIGKRFGSSQGSSNLVFKNNINSTIISWQDTSIDVQVPVSSSFGDNQVIVKKTGLPDSNPVSFTVLKNEVGPGQQCYDNVCPLNPGVCWNPPEDNNIFSCRSNTTDDTTDCYCCCNPVASPDKCKSINTRLSCKAGQTPCTGASRGLCCGCQKDSDCGVNMGCGMKEQDIKCCYWKPTWLITYHSCGGWLATADGVPLNTANMLVFGGKMDLATLNNDNIKVSYDGSCSPADDGEIINSRCYIHGTITHREDDTRSFAYFFPKSCRLKTSTKYKIEIVVAENGEGVTSEKGVAMGVSAITPSCGWTNTKKCQSQSFTTSADVNNLCNINSVEVQPSSKTVSEVGVNVDYYAYAKDSAGNAICVNNFTWSSGDSIVATVVASADPKIGVATSKSKGETTVIASTSGKVCVQTPEENRTCGKIKVDLGGPRVIENQDCSDCSLGGPSPSPWKSSTDACINALVVAKFDRAMNVTTLNSDNIKLFKCTGTTDVPICAEANLSPVNISISSDKKGFYLQFLDIDTLEPLKPKALEPNTIYKVLLKSGDTGIKDSNGYQLDGNRNNLSDGTPKDDYVWYFKTKSGTDPCLLNKVCVNPHEAQITPPTPPITQEFKGEVITT